MKQRHCQISRPSGDTNSLFEEFFSETAIVHALVSLRLKTADRRHEVQRRLDITSSTAGLSPDADWLGLFPPRDKWHQVRPRKRSKGMGASRKLSLLRAVQRGLRAPDSSPWASKLKSVIAEIRRSALVPEGHRFQEPVLLPFAKSTRNEYRIAATMRTTADKVIDHLLGAYLRRLVDPQLGAGVVAYRASSGPNRETAIGELKEFRLRHAGKDLFVAEVDIQSFFDCVPHALALHALSSSPLDGRIDPRAQATVAHLLARYDRASIRDREPELRTSYQLSPEAKFPWPSEFLEKVHGNLSTVRIGLPQGTAIATVLSNLVLHEADQASLAALSVTTENDAVYFRYCDDVAWVGVNEARVAKAQRAFQEALFVLKLPIHAPQPPSLDAAFFHQKSKSPYRWTERIGSGSSRWISFLGYQLDFEGRLRIRQDSINRLRRRMVEEVEQALDLARRPGLRISLPNLFRRTAGRLLALSTGRLGHRTHYQDPDNPCWAKAFRLAGAKGPVRSQLRGLDHHRHRQVEHLFRRFLRLTKNDEERDDLRSAVSVRLPLPAARSFVARFDRMQ
jgi:hypothetical protein